MKVKILESIFDTDNTPIMLSLSEEEKKSIAGMPDGYGIVCFYNSETPKEEIEKFMGVVNNGASVTVSEVSGE